MKTLNRTSRAPFRRWGGLILCALLTIGATFPGEETYPYKDIGDGEPATQVTLTLVDGVAVDEEGLSLIHI